MAGVRRSGRISKEIPIVLLGTDTSGRVFSEETRTLVLSRHGAGIISRHKFSPDDVLLMRIPSTGQEAEIRLVGHLGPHPNGFVYGVAFCNPALDFWHMDFPPPAQEHLLPPGVALECSFCNSRSLVQQNEIESDVYLASNSVFRYCESCGQSTPWKPASGAVSESSPVIRPAVAAPPPPASVYFSSSIHAERESAITPPSPAPRTSAYAAVAVLDEIVTSGFMPATKAAVATPPTPSESASTTRTEIPAFAAGGKKNRRRHVRTRVTFTACIRLDASTEELVECDNASKGGLCFRSLRKYEDNETILVAVPYSPGHPAIFVKAEIRRVETLPGALFRYGIAYV